MSWKRDVLPKSFYQLQHGKTPVFDPCEEFGKVEQKVVQDTAQTYGSETTRTLGNAEQRRFNCVEPFPWSKVQSSLTGCSNTAASRRLKLKTPVIKTLTTQNPAGETSSLRCYCDKKNRYVSQKK